MQENIDYRRAYNENDLLKVQTLCIWEFQKLT